MIASEKSATASTRLRDENVPGRVDDRALRQRFARDRIAHGRILRTGRRDDDECLPIDRAVERDVAAGPHRRRRCKDCRRRARVIRCEGTSFGGGIVRRDEHLVAAWRHIHDAYGCQRCAEGCARCDRGEDDRDYAFENAHVRVGARAQKSLAADTRGAALMQMHRAINRRTADDGRDNA
jgi:hypothetical protein